MAAAVVLVPLAFLACVSSGPGSDFDGDGLKDSIEDPNGDFLFDPGESDFIRSDTDIDGLCDGLPGDDRKDCTGCEDCGNDGFWDPCVGETDPLNDDTDNDGARDGADGAPLDNAGIDCGAGDVRVPYGSSLPPGKAFPVRPAPTTTPAPFPTSTSPPGGNATPTPNPAG